MTKLGLLARIEAKPEYAEKVEALLRTPSNWRSRRSTPSPGSRSGRTRPPSGSSTPSPTSKGVRGTSRERSPPR
ncbi:hypothetical protein WKI71_01375 [Streptomyces sp. MS1.AVA.1]|uniref:Uncharacterized protein n=1 Tax=Streptomyces machairae TaxID=3134109 RepID=A0ABU8UFM1_9ACTN